MSIDYFAAFSMTAHGAHFKDKAGEVLFYIITISLKKT